MTATFNLTGCPLPVELAGFEANWTGEQAELRWDVHKEINTAEYFVERLSGEQWVAVDRQPAVGAHSYTAFDAHVTSGTHVYRLRARDHDGAEYGVQTAVLQIGTDEAAASIRVHPNPVSEVLKVSNYSGTYRLLDLTGRSVQQGELQANSRVSLGSDLPNGRYILQLGQQASLPLEIRR